MKAWLGFLGSREISIEPSEVCPGEIKLSFACGCAWKCSKISPVTGKPWTSNLHLMCPEHKSEFTTQMASVKRSYADAK